MKLGYFCIVSSVASLTATIWMLANGTVFARGFIVSGSLFLFGLYLTRRSREQDAIRRWARGNPEEAIKWLESNKGDMK